jgi:hypothetical protein
MVLVIADHFGMEAAGIGHMDIIRREHASHVTDEVHVSSPSNFNLDTAKKKKKDQDFCNWDFTFGDDLKDTDQPDVSWHSNKDNYCKDPSQPNVRKVEDISECHQAVVEAGLNVTYIHDFTEVASGDLNRQTVPTGCFLADCVDALLPAAYRANPHLYNSGPNGDTKYPCLFWNNYDGPMGILKTGRPVCRRDKITLGEKGMNPTDTTGCPAGYGPIQDKAICETAGPCAGHSLPSDGTVDIHSLEEDLYNKYPIYCLVGYRTDGQASAQVYYNRPLSGVTSEPTYPAQGPANDTSGQDTTPNHPLCNVTSRTVSTRGGYPMSEYLTHTILSLTR